MLEREPVSDYSRNLNDLTRPQTNLDIVCVRESKKQMVYSISLERGCFIGGTITTRHGFKEMYINSIAVEDSLKGRGIGKKLLSALVSLALEENVETIYGDVISKEMLRTMASVLGKDSLHFFEIPEDYPDGQSNPVSESFEEILVSFTGLRVEARIKNNITGLPYPSDDLTAYSTSN